MESSRWSEDKIHNYLINENDTEKIVEHFWLSQFWKKLVFNASYTAPNIISDLVIPTEIGNRLALQCNQETGVPIPEVKLALYGRFYWQDILIDCSKSDLKSLTEVLINELSQDRVRFPFIFGRLLNDLFYDLIQVHPDLADHSPLPHTTAWNLLTDTPVGVFQHGVFISGPLGIIRSKQARWLPAASFVTSYCRKGTKVVRKYIPFDTPSIGIVKAYAWIEHALSSQSGAASKWHSSLAWYGSIQIEGKRNDYSDIPLVIADCLIGSERTKLFETILKTSSGATIRALLKITPSTKNLASV